MTQPGSADEPLLPPRPNLGPEPWQASNGIDFGDTVVLALIVLILVSVALLAWRRRHRSHRRATTKTPGLILESESLTPADRLVARAEAVREGLIAAFGPGWAARTTEEVAAAPELSHRIGADRASQVVALLTEADRAKFAGGEASLTQGETEEADRWVVEVVEALSATGASSTTNGR